MGLLVLEPCSSLGKEEWAKQCFSLPQHCQMGSVGSHSLQASRMGLQQGWHWGALSLAASGANPPLSVTAQLFFPGFSNETD